MLYLHYILYFIIIFSPTFLYTLCLLLELLFLQNSKIFKICLFVSFGKFSKLIFFFFFIFVTHILPFFLFKRSLGVKKLWSKESFILFNFCSCCHIFIWGIHISSELINSRMNMKYFNHIDCTNIKYGLFMIMTSTFFLIAVCDMKRKITQEREKKSKVSLKQIVYEYMIGGLYSCYGLFIFIYRVYNKTNTIIAQFNLYKFYVYLQYFMISATVITFSNLYLYFTKDNKTEISFLKYKKSL